ncbi:MAG: hypothetical protein DMG06_27740, partial [Acidobacteria bacterium]
QFHLGMCYYKNGETERARNFLNNAIRLNPQFPGADEARKTLESL